MDFRKLRLPAVLALICISFFVTFLQVKANKEMDDAVSPAAVWNPESDDLAEIEQACNAAQDYGRCFIDQMGNFASSEAVAFSKYLLEQPPSHVGYLKELREAGSVDLGVVAYSRAGGLRQGWVLLNGVPAVINVDDISRLPQAAMGKNPQFNVLSKNYPHIRLFIDADQRKDNTKPEIRDLAEGGQRFMIDYSLKEACAACPTIAHARFGFDFDAAGRFMGVKFLQVVPLDR